MAWTAIHSFPKIELTNKVHHATFPYGLHQNKKREDVMSN